MAEIEALKHANVQRAGAKRRATLNMLQGKKPAEKEIFLEIDDEEVSLLFVAIGANAYDELQTSCSPTTKQKARGMSFDIDEFPAKLLAAVCKEPAIDEADWKVLLKSPEWNSGEVGDLFQAAVELCNRGLSLGPTSVG